jgi:hypothetical protein
MKFSYFPVIYAVYDENKILFKYRNFMSVDTYKDFVYIANGNQNMLEELIKWYDNHIERNYYRPNYISVCAIKHIVGNSLNNAVRQSVIEGHDLSSCFGEVNLVSRANVVIKKLNGSYEDMIRIEYPKIV